MDAVTSDRFGFGIDPGCARLAHRLSPVTSERAIPLADNDSRIYFY